MPRWEWSTRVWVCARPTPSFQGARRSSCRRCNRPVSALRPARLPRRRAPPTFCRTRTPLFLVSQKAVLKQFTFTHDTRGITTRGERLQPFR
eukprot:1403418-Prymnesium_polylepis.2